MEHRYARRLPARFDVLIHVKGHHTLQGKSCNISTDGIFVDLFDSRLRKNDIVEIEFEQTGLPSIKQKSMVVHVSPTGIGLIFLVRSAYIGILAKPPSLNLDSPKFGGGLTYSDTNC